MSTNDDQEGERQRKTSKEQIDWQAIVDAFTEVGKQATVCIDTFTAVVAPVVEQVIDYYLTVASSIIDVLFQAYTEAGAPYGDSHEGLLRWMGDVSDIRKHEAAIERIKDHHDTLICARRLGEQMRENRNKSIFE